jgi:hypothetical protein
MFSVGFQWMNLQENYLYLGCFLFSHLHV